MVLQEQSIFRTEIPWLRMWKHFKSGFQDVGLCGSGQEPTEIYLQPYSSFIHFIMCVHVARALRIRLLCWRGLIRIKGNVNYKRQARLVWWNRSPNFHIFRFYSPIEEDDTPLGASIRSGMFVNFEEAALYGHVCCWLSLLCMWAIIFASSWSWRRTHSMALFARRLLRWYSLFCFLISEQAAVALLQWDI